MLSMSMIADVARWPGKPGSGAKSLLLCARDSPFGRNVRLIRSMDYASICLGIWSDGSSERVACTESIADTETIIKP
jgi:hypothetical protein